MSVVATVSMLLQVPTQAHACDGVNEILRGEQSSFREDSPLILKWTINSMKDRYL